MQPSLFGTAQWSVSALTKYIRDALETDVRLQDVWVEGETSNLSRPASGHVYFTLKDAQASLRCVVWKSSVARLGLTLQDGMAVAAHGRIGVYEGSGQYQLYVDLVRTVGEGALYQEFLRLKVALEAEGLFLPERKRSIPSFPKRIGVVTSATGAAVKDVLQTLRRRLPLAEVVLATAAVQGDEAPGQLVLAMQNLNHLLPRPDVILLVRGGGSIEDLWAFNDERLVRSVAASATPVISGVGHETDFTLADFAADVRAPTPTAAAELATPLTVLDLGASVRDAASQLTEQLLALLDRNRSAVVTFANDLRYQSPWRRIQTDRQRLDELARRAWSGHSHHLALASEGLDGLSKRLGALNPIRVLDRGYAVVTRRGDGVIVRKVAQATDGITIRVSDGEFEAEVKRRGA